MIYHTYLIVIVNYHKQFSVEVKDSFEKYIQFLKTIDKPIGRHKTQRKMMSCNSNCAKRAVTHYEMIDKFDGFTHLKCKLETGRTHQIRVHMSTIGHFVIGDEVYGRSIDKIKLDFEGQCLHAKTLGFVHPSTKQFMRFDSELPDYFKKTLNKLQSISKY